MGKRTIDYSFVFEPVFVVHLLVKFEAACVSVALSKVMVYRDI